jgi:hypothetical protein
LTRLRKAAYDSFDQRRSYEWKLSFGIWTAMAAFSAMLVTQPINEGRALPVAGVWSVLATALVAAAIAYVHIKFLSGMGRAHNADRLISWHYEREMRDRLLVLPFGSELDEELDRLRSRMGTIGNWSYFSQYAITLLLGAAAVLAMVSRS